MLAKIRKTYHVVKHKKPVTPMVANGVMLTLSALVFMIMLGVSLVIIDAGVRTHVNGRTRYVTVVNGEPTENYALYVRGRWEPVDRLTYFRCDVRDEYPRCAR